MPDDESWSTDEVATVGCGAAAVGAAVGAVGAIATVAYIAYKAYEAIANSDTKITVKIEEGAGGQG